MIGEKYGISVGSVQSSINAALEAIRKELAEEPRYNQVGRTKATKVRPATAASVATPTPRDHPPGGRRRQRRRPSNTIPIMQANRPYASALHQYRYSPTAQDAARAALRKRRVRRPRAKPDAWRPPSPRSARSLAFRLSPYGACSTHPAPPQAAAFAANPSRKPRPGSGPETTERRRADPPQTPPCRTYRPSIASDR